MIRTADGIDHGSYHIEDCLEAVIYRFEDRGPAWLGDMWCDLYLGEHDACVQWGDQYRKVWKVK